MEISKQPDSVTLKDCANSPINILEVIGNASIGGMENYLESFITHLPADNFRVTCICPYESRFTQELRKLGVRDVFITPIEDDPAWRSIQLVIEVARMNCIDILHAHMPRAHVLAGLASCLVHKPVVATVHGMNVTSQELGIARAVGSHLITNCQEAYTQALAMGLPSDRIGIVRNGVDTEIFNRRKSDGLLRKELGVPDDAKLIGFVGRLAWEKGPDIFLRAAQYVHRYYPDAHFIIAGDGEMREEVGQLCTHLQLESRVHFAGWISKPVDLYSEIDLLVHTSRSDGTSLVLLEGMACKCPVVALAVGGVREILEHENTGFLVGGGDWEGAGNRIVQLLAEPQRCKQMGEAARERVECYFNVRINTEYTAAILRRVASPGMSSGRINNKKAVTDGILQRRNSFHNGQRSRY